MLKMSKKIQESMHLSCCTQYCHKSSTKSRYIIYIQSFGFPEEDIRRHIQHTGSAGLLSSNLIFQPRLPGISIDVLNASILNCLQVQLQRVGKGSPAWSSQSLKQSQTTSVRYFGNILLAWVREIIYPLVVRS